MGSRNSAEPVVLIPEAIWRDRQERHVRAVDQLTAEHLQRRRRGEPHPVVDFLFTYYRPSVATIRRWHPGPGVVLENAHHSEMVDRRHYRRDSFRGIDGLAVAADSVVERCGARIDRARRIVEATASRAGSMACFGLHEWAMLYRAEISEVRHEQIPLRVSPAEIEDVINRSRPRCTHFDAFRFFTGPARPLNLTPLTRDGQTQNEQPACLHAGMDLYAHVAAMEAGAPGELLLATFRASLDARKVDMRSSPYDLSSWGLDPIRVETAEGRAEFVEHQRLWIRRTQALRSRFLDAVTRLEVRALSESRRTSVVRPW